MKVTSNTAQYPLHHEIYAPARFEAATPNIYGADAFTIKYGFELELGDNVTIDDAKHPLHHVTYAFANNDVACLFVCLVLNDASTLVGH